MESVSQRSWLLFLVLFLSSTCSLAESDQFCDAGIGFDKSTCGTTSSSKLLIKGGTVVNAYNQEVADVYVENGIIIAVKPNIKVGDDVAVLDATGKYVMPGGIDPHTHLAFEFMGTETVDDFFTGQAAALAGGTTMHIDFVIPTNGSLSAGFESYEKKAKKSCMDYGFHMAVTKWDEVVSQEMDIMVNEKGINSFKFFLAYKGALMISDELLLQGLKKCKSLGALAMVHAENGDAVYEGQERMIELGITGPEGHALSRPAVVRGLSESQSCLGIEERMHLVWNTMVESGQISVSDYVRITSTECARIFNIYPKKGAILAGSDADIIILNPNASFEISAKYHHSRLDTNVYDGKRGKGKVEVTIAGGRIVWENDELKVVPGAGKYIEMPAFNYLFDGIDKADARYLSSIRAPVKRFQSKT